MIIKYEIPDEGAHAATITKLVPETNYSQYGKKAGVKIAFRLSEPGVLGKPFDVSRLYPISLHHTAAIGKLVRELKLFKDGVPIDLAQLAGKACTVTIKHKVSRYGMTYAVVVRATGSDVAVRVSFENEEGEIETGWLQDQQLWISSD